MKDIQSLSDELLKQEGLARNEASKSLLAQVQRFQAKAEKRERFWFRIACGFWIIAGICFLLVGILGGLEAHMSMSGGSAGGVNVPPEAAKAPVVVVGSTEPQFRFHPVRTPFVTALVTLPVAVLGGIFSSVWLIFTRRQAGQATMQMTLVALTNEIRDLKEQRNEERGKSL